MADARKLRVLFLCSGNSCRSQMAEGWTRALRGDAFEAWSAGTRATSLDPLAVAAMAEAGVDISRQRSKTIAELGGLTFDVVVTVCDHARQTCPVFPGAATRLHVSVDDPPELAAGVSSDEEARAIYRRVRDELRAFVESMPEKL